MNDNTELPTFAVIGRVNEGKSSLVSTLMENDRIAVGPDPGTTEKSDPYTVVIDGRPLLRLIDTPGFEEPEAVMAWLENQKPSVENRHTAIKAFLNLFSSTDEYRAECELLTPVVNGANIIYVVSSNHPFRAGYATEMEILRWTGQPRLAIINRLPGNDYSAEWKRALGQYFNVVKVFDAHQGRFTDRIALLDVLRVIDERHGPALQLAIKHLKNLQERRLAKASRLAAELLASMISYRLKIPEGRSDQPNKTYWIDEFHNHLRKLEQGARPKMEELFLFSSLKREEHDVVKPVYEEDLFATETWEMLGQKPVTLTLIGAALGGVVGGAVDLKTGGTTSFLGTPIGAVIGGASTLGAALSKPKIRWGGLQLSGKVTILGPHKNPNFPWIILDRLLLHLEAILTRAHAVRTKLIIDAGEKQGIVSKLDKQTTLELARLFKKISKAQEPSDAQIERLGLRLLPLVEQIARNASAL